VRAVLVTGASTGIGRSVVERLSRAGHFVYAGARKSADLRTLGFLENVQPVRLDVTSPEDVGAAFELIARAGRGLYGLVNNAGIATIGPILRGDEQELALVMAVNVHGTYRVTRAMTPLVVAQRGRVVTIGSISGTLASKDVGVYSMSKHALEAFTDSLAAELECLGVGVAIIEPGMFNTRLVANAGARLIGRAQLPDLSHSASPEAVAEAVAQALFDAKPRRRYLVVTSEAEARKTIQKQITRLVELNEGHSFSFDRAGLIHMLDEAVLVARASSRSPQPPDGTASTEHVRVRR
jgi:NAD(P)-dependent dehydrogenase (short-subunit alcohol dehydrogenase family)